MFDRQIGTTGARLARQQARAGAGPCQVRASAGQKLAQQAKRRQRYQVLTAIVVAVVVVIGIVAIAKWRGNGSSTVGAGASTKPSASTTTASPSPSPTVTAVVPTDGTPALCAYRTASTSAKTGRAPPTSGPTAPATRTAKISLNGKVVTVQLFASKAPCTVNSFVHLAAGEVLRRHAVPPAHHGQPRRPPVRRPQRHRQRRPRLPVQRREPDRRDLPGRHGGHGQRRRRTPTAASSSSSTPTRSSGRSTPRSAR